MLVLTLAIGSVTLLLFALPGCSSGGHNGDGRAGTVPEVHSAAEILQFLAKKSPARYHEVVAGETVSKIARQYETTPWRIITANRLGDGNRIETGQRLLIPWPDREPAAYVSETTNRN